MDTKLIAIPMNYGKSNYHINQPYIDYIIKSGFTPLAVFNKDMCDDNLAKECHGLLLPGGIDIDPIYYGEDNENSFGVIPEKDDFERTLLNLFAGNGKPVFAICRGFQLVMREIMLYKEQIDDTSLDDYSYYQHINGHQTNDKNSTRRDVRTHSLLMNKDELYGDGPKNTFVRGFVNSMHHQGVLVKENAVITTNKNKEIEIRSKFGDVTITGFTPFGVNRDSLKDKDRKVVIEAADIKFKNSLIRGVQWHPEELMETGLLKHYFGNNETKKGKTNAV